MRFERFFGLCALLFLMLSGCASKPQTQRALQGPEERIKTNSGSYLLFHAALYHPSEISLNFPGFIIGIEKSPVAMVSQPGDIVVQAVPNAGLSQAEAYDTIVDKKVLFISHIVEDMGQAHGLGNCTLYDAYRQTDDAPAALLAEPCPGVSDAPIAASSAYKSSWTALDILQQRLRERLSKGDYSHILVAIMGWNTTQIEAVRNFNAIAKNIRAAADDDFNPLFIGVTWPSQWQNEWLAPLYKLASFPNKAQDADELGLMWLGVLLHDTLPAIDPQIPIVVIGHSFGARAATTAACAGPVIHQPGSPIAKKQLDQLTLIGLQGAFRVNRLFGQFSDRKIGFQDQCRSVGHIYLTSSLADTANDTAFWGDYAGDEASYAKFCGEESSLVNCEKADQSGHRTQQRDSGSNITYIDADDLIYLNSYLSGGGAHSDIYRKEHGLLMYDLISRSKAMSSASGR